VLILRVPKGVSIITPPSTCPSCGKRVPFYLNIPLFSYLFLRGKSLCCSLKLSPLYFFGELCVMLIFLVVFFKLGFGLDFLRVAVVFSLLFALSVIDLKDMAIPDSISLSASLISLLSVDIDVIKSFLILAGAGTMLRFFVSYMVKKEAMGEGDIIVFAILGALLGLKGAFGAVFVASCLALPIFLIVGKNSRVPFVPFLALGGFLVFIFGIEIGSFLEGINEY